MPVRSRETERPQAQIGCGNNSFGCGKLCRVLKVDPISKCVILAEGYHAGIRLCLGCANSAAHNWNISFDDLDYLMCALHNAKAGKCGVAPSKEEVWALLSKIGVKPIRKPGQLEWSAAKPTALPLGDQG